MHWVRLDVSADSSRIRQRGLAPSHVCLSGWVLVSPARLIFALAEARARPRQRPPPQFWGGFFWQQCVMFLGHTPLQLPLLNAKQIGLPFRSTRNRPCRSRLLPLSGFGAGVLSLSSFAARSFALRRSFWDFWPLLDLSRPYVASMFA